MTSCRRNERCQSSQTSWFDFIFHFAFANENQFESIFSFIMEDIGTMWLFEFELSQNYRDSVPINLLNAS